MKLISANIKNYRIHDDVRVDFDASRTLIGGPNEAGKSTLVEAIHRALFLKSTVTGDAQKSMKSNKIADHPEVALRFEIGGTEYNLLKRFSGGNGTTQLVEAGGETWSGEEAETKLAGLLGVEEATSGRNILNRIQLQWAHLWVWQGMSGDEPAAHTSGQQADLIQRLQEVGGAVAMQSPLDDRVAGHFSELNDSIFVKAGKAKSGSDLDRAQQEAKVAADTQKAALDRLAGLSQSIKDAEESDAIIQRTVDEQEKLRNERQAVELKKNQLDEFRGVEENQASALEGATGIVTDMEDAEKKISELRKSEAELKASLEPRQKEESRVTLDQGEYLKKIEEAEKRYDATLGQARLARQRKELSESCISLYEKTDIRDKLLSRLKRVQTLEEKISEIRDEDAKLISIDSDGLQDLKDQENELAKADAALSAMAAEIEVIAADAPIQIGDGSLCAGERQTVTESTDIKISDTVSLRVQPGGGDALGESRDKVRTLKDELTRLLDEYGLSSTAEAAKVVAQREKLQKKLEKSESALEELEAEDLSAECADTQSDCTAAEAAVKRNMKQQPDAVKPADLTAARGQRDIEQKALNKAEAEESAAKEDLDNVRSRKAGLDEELAEVRETITEDRQNLAGFEANLKMLLEDNGTDANRAKSLKKARQDKKDANDVLAGTQKEIDALQPELLQGDLERLNRALTEVDRNHVEAETKLAVSQAALRMDGAEDPYAELAAADAVMVSAEEQLAAISRKAEAVKLLNSLFGAEQRALADEFSQPLGDKITDYLQCMFGPEVSAKVNFENNAFESIKLVRSVEDGAMAFDLLSRGTREQVSAAVRLAIAELLAAGHDDCLPIVFDDAFANSDPQRIDMLQRMLDLGANRGLQIIVLSCNPIDYTLLGARQRLLSEPGAGNGEDAAE